MEESASKKMLLIATLLSITIFGCSKKVFLDKNYRGIPNNPKVLNEGLWLKANHSYSFNYSVYDVGQYASNIEYIGKYKISNGRIRFTLDTIKSFNSRVYKPNEKRNDNPFSDHKTSIVNSEQKEAFASSQLRLKPEYSIDSNNEIIKDRLQERFTTIELLR